MTFQITLPGFDGGTDKTDHLIKWVNAHDIVSVVAFLDRIGVRDAEVEEMEEMNRDLGFEDGVDVELDEFGQVVSRSAHADELTWNGQCKEIQ